MTRHIEFQLLPPPEADANISPILLSCKTCKEEMTLAEIEKHAIEKHYAESISVSPRL